MCNAPLPPLSGYLPERELVSYVQHEALLWEYHKKAMELMDTDMRAVLKTLYSEEGYKGSGQCGVRNLYFVQGDTSGW